jgi:hypothetical protein
VSFDGAIAFVCMDRRQNGANTGSARVVRAIRAAGRWRAQQTKIGTGLGMCGAESYLREEAYRLDTLREGEKVIELPAIQAVFRAMGLQA